MTGFVQRHGKDWRYVIQLDVDENGKRKSITKSGFRLEKEAKKALANKLSDIDTGKYVEDKRLTVEGYLEDWLEAHKSNVAPSTFKRYKEFCNTINKHLGKQELLKLTPLTIQKFYSKLISDTSLSNSTILKIHRCLSLALKQAVGWNFILRNPCEHAKPPRAENYDIAVWDEDTANKFLLESREENLYIPIALALGTGMRQGEICALKWENVDLTKGEIFIKKTVKKFNGEVIMKEPKTKGSIRRIPIPDELKDLLIFHKKKTAKMITDVTSIIDIDINKKMNDMFVCCWEDDFRMIDPMYIAKKFPKILENYEVPKIRFHDLRHTHATILLLHDVPAKVVSERLGHSTIAITLDTYSHVLPSMQKAAAEKLTNLFKNINKKETSNNLLCITKTNLHFPLV